MGSNSESGQSTSDIYSWYEEQVITDVMNDLKEEYGYSSQYVSQMLSNGGLRIYTCVDPQVQAAAEAIYYDRSNLNYTSSKTGQQLQSAITIIDNSTGDIAGLVGRIGEKTINRGTNLATGALRQPGSSIKPLTAYAPAMEMGLLSPISVLPDYPLSGAGRQSLAGERRRPLPWPGDRNRGAAVVLQHRGRADHSDGHPGQVL